MVNFGPMESVPKKFAGRKLYIHTPMSTLMRTNLEENIKLGEIIASKLNKSKGKTIVLLPKKGFSSLDRVGEEFSDLDCDLAFAQSLKDHLHEKIRVVELDCHINDDEYAMEAVDQFLKLLY
jgi:uncharacterized protein (UPF0261 family)